MRLLVALTGLLLGVAAAVGVLLVNPAGLFGPEPPAHDGAVIMRQFRLDDRRGIDPVGTDLLGLGDAGARTALAEPALRHAGASVFVLPAGDGYPAALAVRLSAAATGNSLLRSRLRTTEHWALFFPGEGGLFAATENDFWPVNRDLFWRRLRGGDRQGLAGSYGLTAGRPAQAPLLVGFAGRHGGVTGQLHESIMPGGDGLTRTLQLILQEPPP